MRTKRNANSNAKALRKCWIQLGSALILTPVNFYFILYKEMFGNSDFHCPCCQSLLLEHLENDGIIRFPSFIVLCENSKHDIDV